MARAGVTVALIVLLGAGSALAGGRFDDVEDGRYYAEPVAWAARNEITTGCDDGRFCPDVAVTRGQNVTFAWRYDQYVVQPALDEIETRLHGTDERVTSVEFDLAAAQTDRSAMAADIAAAATRTELVVRDGEVVYPAIVPTNGETALVLIDGRWWAYAAAYGWGVQEAHQYFESSDCTGTAHISLGPLSHRNQVAVSGMWYEATHTGTAGTVNVGSYLSDGSCTLYDSDVSDLVPISLGDELDPPALTDPYLDING